MPPFHIDAVVLQFDLIEDAVSAFKNGEFIVVLDDPSRENEGDLVIAAQDLTPEKTAFMIRHTSGLICTPIMPNLSASLNLPQMVTDNEDPNQTAYTISIDCNNPKMTTGISASDRALTCQMLATKGVKSKDFRRPGHIFPLQAKSGGIRERVGHTEAALEFCRLAGKEMVGAISEIVDDGQAVEGQTIRTKSDMMRRDGCLAFGKKWGLKVCTIEDLVKYIKAKEGEVTH